MNTNVVDEKYAAGLKYKPQEFAQILGVSVKTLQRWDREGILKAHRTITNRRYYTYDQLGDITKEQQYESVMDKRRSILHASLMTRGELYVMIRDTLLEHKELDTAENRVFVQDLINKVLELPARWPSGAPMEQSARLDADLIWNADVIEIVYKCWNGPDGSPNEIICRKIVDGINNIRKSAEIAAKI